MGEAPLRIAIVFAEGPLRLWQLECVRLLQASPHAEVTALIRLPTKDTKAGASVYAWWLRRMGKKFPFLAFAAPPLPDSSIDLGMSDPRAMIRSLGCDALLQLNGLLVPPEWTDGLPFGHWYFTLAGCYCEDPIPGVHERMRGDNVIECALVQCKSGHVQFVRTACFGRGTEPMGAVANEILSNWTHWPALACMGRSIGATTTREGTVTEVPVPFAVPGNLGLARVLIREAAGTWRTKGNEYLPNDVWNIGVLHQPIEALLENDPNRNIRWLTAPRTGSSRSMPFGWIREERLHVVYRKSTDVQHNTVIARIRPKQDDNLKRSRTILSGPIAYSYPCIVDHAGVLYAVPEQCAHGKVDLYRISSEHSDLEFQGTLLHEPLHSPTLFFHEGRWWIFGTSTAFPDAELLAFHGMRPEGPFVPHALNPIKTDVRSSRSGGTPFSARNWLWRPVQDASGPRPQVRINRIVELTPTRFLEETGEVVKSMSGPWGHGIRTISMVGDITLVDGLNRAAAKSTQGRSRSPHKRRNVRT